MRLRMLAGGQFMRAVAQRCRHNGPPMRTLITVGAQHQGVYNLPQCGTDEADPSSKPSSACLAIQYLLGASAYAPYVRDHVVQAQYFKVRPTHRPRGGRPWQCYCLQPCRT